MAQLLGQVAVGSVVKINENGSPVNYIVVHQGLPSSLYDASCDGTWVLQQDIYENRQWNSSNSNSYKASTIHTYLNGTFLNLFNAGIREVIKQVKIPYVNGTGDSAVASGSSGLSCKIFLLSGREVGFSTSDSQYFPNDGAKLSYFESGSGSSALNKRIAKLNGSAARWWLRSPNTNVTGNAWRVGSDGGSGGSGCSVSYGIRPALVLPSSLSVSDDGSVVIVPDPPATLTVPAQAMQGQPIAVSWPAADNADGYILERSADSGAWTQVYSGANTSYTDTAGAWTTVQYRVKAGLDGNYGEYTTSASVPVASASALTISGSDGSLGTLTADVEFSVNTNTGNQIDLRYTVNGAQWYAGQVSGGYAGTIPVMELPTGNGTIVVTASVQATADKVTVTRTWTYNKTVPAFPAGPFDISTLSKGGKTQFPLTLAECVKFPLGAEPIVFRDGKRKALSDYSVGDRVFVNVSGEKTPFIVGSKNYEGSGAVALVLDQVSQQTAWDSGGSTTFDGSTLDSKCQEFINALSADAQSALVTCSVKTSASANSSIVNTIQRKCTVPSLTELSYTTGQYSQNFNTEGTSFGLADLRTVSDESGENQRTWTRSVPNDVAGQAFYLRPEEQITQGAPTSSQYFRPMIFMSADYSGEFFDYSTPPTLSLANGEQITIPSDQLDQSTKIATGSYAGTGAYGTGTVNTLTFESDPVLLLIAGVSSDTTYIAVIMCDANTGITFSGGQGPWSTWKSAGIWVTKTGSKVDWCAPSDVSNSDAPAAQMNISGVTYTYAAILS